MKKTLALATGMLFVCSGIIYATFATSDVTNVDRSTLIKKANAQADEIKSTIIIDSSSDKNNEDTIVDYDSMTPVEIEIAKIPQYEKLGYTPWDIPKNSGFKSFMDYKTITDTESQQYKLQNTHAVTGDYGIRMAGGRYCVAIGSHFNTEIGQYFDIILKNGIVIPCIMADLKDDEHTDEDNIVTVHNGCMTEFIVDADVLDTNAKFHGDISYCNENWNSQIAGIKVYNVNIFRMP